MTEDTSPHDLDLDAHEKGKTSPMILPTPNPSTSTACADQPDGSDEADEKEYQSDSSDALDKYRLTSKPDRPPKKEAIQNAEHVAFMSWVANENRATEESMAKTDVDADVDAQTPSTSSDDPNAAAQVIATPREYQTELFERAKRSNTIVVLDTGCGKTFIAVLLLRHTLSLELEHRAEGKPKRTAFFLVDKVALCVQQHRFLEANLEFPIGKMHGERSGAGRQEEWDVQGQHNMVIVCTAQILLDLLGSGLVAMRQINLLIFDEAHHTKKNHPYASIVRDYYIRMKEDRPRILGLTASPVDSKTNDFHAAALDLEQTLCSRIATVSDEALHKGMERKAQIEQVVQYPPLVNPTDATTTLCQSLANLFAWKPNFRTHIEAAKNIASVLGTWAADHYWRLLFKTRSPAALTELANASGELISKQLEAYHDAGTELDDDLLNIQARHLINAHFESQSTTNTDPSKDFSVKVQGLYELLHDAFVANKTKRCIVFVQKRYIAFLLSEVFQSSTMRIKEVVTGFVVGSQSVSSTIVNMSIRDQMQTFDGFRYGEINCIFATPVAEEGIDIPECDLIIRFDLYDSAIQYIQSKGRARQIHSTYVTMVEEGNIQHRRKILQSTRDLHALRRFCTSLPSDRKIDAPDESQLELEAKSQITFDIRSTGATLTFNSSRQTLAKFVSSVCHSADAHPEYIVMSSDTGKFVTTVLLPESCPVRAFTGNPQRSKLLSRGSAAFKACIELLNRNYVDGHLRPTLTKALPRMRNARLAISDKKRSEYNMRHKPDMWDSPVDGAPLQLFVATLTIEGSGPTGKFGRPLCLLTRSALPEIEPIKLYLGDGVQSLVRQKQYMEPMIVTQKEVATFAKFTLTVFSDVFSKEYECRPEDMPYYVAPCKLSPTATPQYDDDQQLDQPLCAARAIIDWVLLTHDGEAESQTIEPRFVIDKWDGSRKFFIHKVNKLFRALDPVPEGVPLPKSRSYLRVERNIAQYSNSLTYHSRQRVIWDPEQPVFDAELLPLRRNFLQEPKHGEVHGSRKCYIVLQPLAVSTLPVDVVVTALALPVIMYRIDSAAIAMDACRLVDLAIDPPLALEAMTQCEEGIDTSTTKNYERLEFLGDCFLKMATTISLFTLIPNSDEFEYHVERMLLVCNQNLFNHAIDRGLQEYVRSKAFDRSTWYPDLKLLRGRVVKRATTHSLADKAVADVCEALIGAAYMTDSENMDLAVKAVTKMVRSKNHTMTKYSEYYEKHVSPTWQTTLPRPVEQLAADMIESSVGYKFNSPRLLRSAFKHPSFPYEPELPNYQRLEFLGDALLDMSIVDFLFRKYPAADPQWLTEHKMAMASNHFFACLCVDLGLHRHMLTSNSSMTGHIASFVEAVETVKARSMQSNEGVASPSFWLNLEHPPKALSDILEALVGAMYEDSKYDYSTVRTFFNKFIAPYFQDMTPYETYTTGHPVTKLTRLLQDTFCCRSWRLCVSPVPCGPEMGASAVTESNVVCALMIHRKKAAHGVRANGKDAKVDVATMALRQLRDLNREEFQKMMGCDCGADQ